MNMLQTLDFLGILASYFVLGTGCGVLFLSDKLLGPLRALRLKTTGVILSTVAAMWWIAATAVLQDASACDAGNLYCVTCALYHLLRSIALLMFHVAIGRDVWQLAQRRGRAKRNRRQRRAMRTHSPASQADGR